MTVGLGEGNNNHAKLLSLKILLIFVTKKGCGTLNVFRYSMNVINWTKGTQNCWNLRLANILSSIKEVINTYATFSCRHVYKENNETMDKASKEGLEMALGIWKIKEQREGNTLEYYHMTFIEWTTFYTFLAYYFILYVYGIYSFQNLYVDIRLSS